MFENQGSGRVSETCPDGRRVDAAVGPDEQSLERLDWVIGESLAVDLHSHSRHSDGHWTPGELIEEARGLGLALVSLTDHDRLEGQAEAARAARAGGLLFLPGMEVSLSVEGRLYHVLCYDFDWTSALWEEFRRHRRRAIERFHLHLFDQLRARGYAVDPDLARGEDGWLVDDPLPHAVLRAGLAPTLDAARQLVNGLSLRRPVELTYLDLAEFAALVPPEAAVFSVAHPARQEPGVSVRLTEEDLRHLTRALPLVALEAYHPYHSAADVEWYRGLAARHGLAVTCGSDAHGHSVRRPLRPHPADLCADFLRIIRDRWARRATAASAGLQERIVH
jgi:predicted metal-dependent phosphoesterase TrpH